MNAEAAVTPVTNQSDRRAGRLARRARSVIQQRLRDLQGGQLLVHDAWGSWSVGTSTSTPVVLRVDDPGFYLDMMLEGSLGAAHSYVENRWSCDDLTALFALLIRNMDLTDDMEGGVAVAARLVARFRGWLNRNSARGSKRNIEAHYDLGNDFFSLFLDETMTYSAGIFLEPGTSLAEASITKLDRLCRKLRLGPDDHVLEIGTGWGSFAIHAAREYGCRVTTTTISREQLELARRRIHDAGLAGQVEVRFEDYRALTGRYDKIVSIEMIEAVGHNYLPAYFSTCARLLEDDGAMALQAITMPDQRYAQYLKTTDFIQRWIFPGSCCPALTAMLEALRDHTDLRVAHLENIGPHYGTTLRRWQERFQQRLPEVRALGYPDTFIRMWQYYLAYCEAGFAERYLGSVQIVLEKPGCRAAPLLGQLAHDE